MSTDWGFYCPTHDEWSGYNINHGQDVLRAMWRQREPIAAIMADEECEVEITSMYGLEAPTFLVAHKDCPLELRSEYGDTEVIAGEQCSATIIAGILAMRCQRSERHSSRHRSKSFKPDICVEWR